MILKFQKLLIENAWNYYQFWFTLEKPSPELDSVFKYGNQILKNEKLLCEFIGGQKGNFQLISKLYEDVTKYGKKILYNPQSLIKAKVEKILRAGLNTREQVGESNQSIDNGIISISENKDNYGEMMECNSAFCSMLNLSKQQIFKSPIHEFLPETIKNESYSFHSIHKSIIFKNVHINTTKTYGFFIDSNGFLKRMLSTVLEYPSMINGNKLIIQLNKIKPQRSEFAELLIDDTNRLIAYSEQAERILEMNFKKKVYDWETLFPLLMLENDFKLLNNGIVITKSRGDVTPRSNKNNQKHFIFNNTPKSKYKASDSTIKKIPNLKLIENFKEGLTTRKGSIDVTSNSLIGFRKLYRNKLAYKTFTLLIFKLKKNRLNMLNSSSESLIVKKATPFNIDPFTCKYYIPDESITNSNKKYTLESNLSSNREESLTNENNVNFNSLVDNYCKSILPTTIFHSVIKKCEKQNFSGSLTSEVKAKIEEKISNSLRFSMQTFRIQKDNKFIGVNLDDALNEILSAKEFKIRREKTSEDELKSIPSYLTSQDKLKKALQNSIHNKGALILYLSFALLLLLPIIFSIVEYILTIQIWDYISIQTDSFQKSYKIIEATGDIHYTIRHLLFRKNNSLAINNSTFSINFIESPEIAKAYIKMNIDIMNSVILDLFKINDDMGNLITKNNFVFFYPYQYVQPNLIYNLSYYSTTKEMTNAALKITEMNLYDLDYLDNNINFYIHHNLNNYLQGMMNVSASIINAIGAKIMNTLSSSTNYLIIFVVLSFALGVSVLVISLILISQYFKNFNMTLLFPKIYFRNLQKKCIHFIDSFNAQIKSMKSNQGPGKLDDTRPKYNFDFQSDSAYGKAKTKLRNSEIGLYLRLGILFSSCFAYFFGMFQYSTNYVQSLNQFIFKYNNSIRILGALDLAVLVHLEYVANTSSVTGYNMPLFKTCMFYHGRLVMILSSSTEPNNTQFSFFLDDYSSYYQNLMNGNLCESPSNHFFNSSKKCEEFENGVATLGMAGVMDKIIQELIYLTRIVSNINNNPSPSPTVSETIISISLLRDNLMTPAFEEFKKRTDISLLNSKVIYKNNKLIFLLIFIFGFMLLFLILFLNKLLELHQKYSKSLDIATLIPLKYICLNRKYKELLIKNLK